MRGPPAAIGSDCATGAGKLEPYAGKRQSESSRLPTCPHAGAVTLEHPEGGEHQMIQARLKNPGRAARGSAKLTPIAKTLAPASCEYR
jgi:hypothetical protein